VAKLELVLDAQRSSWAMSASHGTEHDRSSRNREFYDRVTKRDHQVCRACTWQSSLHQEIHPIDGNHRSKDMDNWVTLCPLCHQVFHLPQASGTGGGRLIWLPEITQAHLNLLSIPLFVASRHPGHRYYGLAQLVNGILSGRASYFQSRMSQDDPMLMAQIIVTMKPEQYARRGETLRHIRLWPQRERFEVAIDHWEQNNFKDWKDTEWEKALPAGFDLSQLLPTETAYG
jgi:intracellular multiplication protein IcmJ